MVVLGLILILLALAAGALAVYGLPTADANKVSWDVLGNSLSISPTTIFFIGVASAVALALGLWLMGLGARSSARKRRELKDLRREQKQQDRIAQERSHTSSTDRTTPRSTTDRRDADTVREGDARGDGATSWNDTTR